MKAKLFLTSVVFILLSLGFSLSLARPKQEMGDALAKPEVISIDIQGPSAASRGQEVTYIITYEDVIPTGGIEYTIQGIPFHQFLIVSVDPEPNYRPNSLDWPYGVLPASSGTITITGRHLGCGQITHIASHYDLHPDPIPDLPSDSITTDVQCDIYLPIIFKNHAINGQCYQAVANGSFEIESDWDLPITEYQAAYSSDQAHNGVWAVRTGITNPADNRYSYSSARQIVTIPVTATLAILRFWLYPLSTETSNLAFASHPLDISPLEAEQYRDLQLISILDDSPLGEEIELRRLAMDRSDDRIWIGYTFDLLDFAGKAIKLYYGAYNNGIDGITAMYVDDVSLYICLP